jgi:hypothetical protein
VAAKGLITLEKLAEKLLSLEETPQDGRARAASPAKPQGALGGAGPGQKCSPEVLRRDGARGFGQPHAGGAPRRFGMLELRMIAYMDGALELYGALMSTHDVGNLKRVCS